LLFQNSYLSWWFLFIVLLLLRDLLGCLVRVIIGVLNLILLLLMSLLWNSSIIIIIGVCIYLVILLLMMLIIIILSFFNWWLVELLTYLSQLIWLLLFSHCWFIFNVMEKIDFWQVLCGLCSLMMMLLFLKPTLKSPSQLSISFIYLLIIFKESVSLIQINLRWSSLMLFSTKCWLRLGEATTRHISNWLPLLLLDGSALNLIRTWHIELMVEGKRIYFLLVLTVLLLLSVLFVIDIPSWWCI